MKSTMAKANNGRRGLRWRGAWQAASTLCVLLGLAAPRATSAQTFLGEWSTDDIGRITPTGMALDTLNGQTVIYVADDVHGRVLKFDPQTGTRLASFGETGTGQLQFNRPFGVAVDPASHDLFVVERGNHRVQRITSGGAFVTAWGGLGTADGQFDSPIGIALDNAGNVYVADYHNHRVQKFHVQGTSVQHVATWGGEGSEPGKFRGPYGLALDGGGNVWVSDIGNHRIQKFAPDGRFLAAVGTAGTGNGQFVTPTWITFDSTGAYYVGDTNSDPSNLSAPDIDHQRIQKFSADGAFLLSWGTLGEHGGQFRMPLAIALDGHDNAYVSDYYNTRVQKFSLTGGGTPTGGSSGGTGPVTGGARFVNLSSRMRTSDDASRAFIAGFVVSGSTPKQMLVRAVGPGLEAFGVSGALANPKLRIFAGDRLIAENDDWSNNADVSGTGSRVGAFSLSSNSRDAAVLVTLQPGLYSAQVVANGGDGVALVEVYDVEAAQATAQLVNLSTRGFVETGAGVLVAGFVINGDQPKRVLIRGIGPTLAQFGVSGVLADAQLKVMHGDTVVAQNDDWSAPQTAPGGAAAASGSDISAAAAATGAFALGANSKDAAVLVTLPPGNYSAVVSGTNDSTGAGLVEVYELK